MVIKNLDNYIILTHTYSFLLNPYNTTSCFMVIKNLDNYIILIYT